MRKPKLAHPRKLVIPDNFNPPVPQEGDEIFRNGIFYSNIEQLLKYTNEYCDEILLTSIDVFEWRSEDLSNILKEEYVKLADIARPVILAEIAPDRLGVYPGIHPSDWKMRGFNLVDGHHRVEKAYRQGIRQIPAYIVSMEQHIKFMYSGYKEYADYWNSKLLDYESDIQRSQSSKL